MVCGPGGLFVLDSASTRRVEPRAATFRANAGALPAASHGGLPSTPTSTRTYRTPLRSPSPDSFAPSGTRSMSAMHDHVDRHAGKHPVDVLESAFFHAAPRFQHSKKHLDQKPYGVVQDDQSHVVDRVDRQRRQQEPVHRDVAFRRIYFMNP